MLADKRSGRQILATALITTTVLGLTAASAATAVQATASASALSSQGSDTPWG